MAAQLPELVEVGGRGQVAVSRDRTLLGERNLELRRGLIVEAEVDVHLSERGAKPCSDCRLARKCGVEAGDAAVEQIARRAPARARILRKKWVCGAEGCR